MSITWQISPEREVEVALPPMKTTLEILVLWVRPPTWSPTHCWSVVWLCRMSLLCQISGYYQLLHLLSILVLRSFHESSILAKHYFDQLFLSVLCFTFFGRKYHSTSNNRCLGLIWNCPSETDKCKNVDICHQRHQLTNVSYGTRVWNIFGTVWDREGSKWPLLALL